MRQYATSTAPYRASRFARFARRISHAAGHPLAFLAAVGVVVVWLATGPLFGFSDTWQLVINTGTTIVTFLMVFLIQNTQNRDSTAVQLKLDELIRAVEGAHTALLDLEELTEDDLEQLRTRYKGIARQSREALRRGQVDTGQPEV
ncbi:MAG TPA: low affinity iron permease family protein [Chloroflexota bacterium]|jgi:low affinity Fe/Cu permease|nr:low affinity iron permease family protein [Chloroflexota bacterium]